MSGVCVGVWWRSEVLWCWILLGVRRRGMVLIGWECRVWIWKRGVWYRGIACRLKLSLRRRVNWKSTCLDRRIGGILRLRIEIVISRDRGRGYMWIGIRHKSAMEMDIKLTSGTTIGESISAVIATIAEKRSGGIGRKRHQS